MTVWSGARSRTMVVGSAGGTAGRCRNLFNACISACGWIIRARARTGNRKPSDSKLTKVLFPRPAYNLDCLSIRGSTYDSLLSGQQTNKSCQVVRSACKLSPVPSAARPARKPKFRKSSFILKVLSKIHKIKEV